MIPPIYIKEQILIKSVMSGPCVSIIMPFGEWWRCGICK